MITYMKSANLKSFDSSMKARAKNWSRETMELDRQVELAIADKRIRESFAKAIHNQREKLGLSQRALAKLVGVSQRDICHIELGKANPTLSTQVKIFTTLGLRMEITGK